MQIISLHQVRALLIHKQLYNMRESPLEILQHLGYVQIDTLAVAARAHHHTFWSRLPSYTEQQLGDLMTSKQAFEYWFHAASYLPMRDFRFSLLRKHDFLNGKSHWFKQDKKIKQYVLDRIIAEGPLQSKDFEVKKTAPSSWFEWKPAKQALEQLFMEGQLMVSSRKGFQKIYDLTERVLPSNVNTSFPSEEEIGRYLINQSMNSLGVVSEKEITYQKKRFSKAVSKTLGKMLKEGEIIQVMIENSGTENYYMLTEELGLFPEIKKDLYLLSPFDNMVIQRNKIKTLFGFDYTIECYLPEAKRKYGYFCLPVLYGDKFIGRLDPKADRKTRTFFIKNLHFENPGEITDEIQISLDAKVREYAAFCGCSQKPGLLNLKLC